VSIFLGDNVLSILQVWYLPHLPPLPSCLPCCPVEVATLNKEKAEDSARTPTLKVSVCTICTCVCILQCVCVCVYVCVYCAFVLCVCIVCVCVYLCMCDREWDLSTHSPTCTSQQWTVSSTGCRNYVFSLDISPSGKVWELHVVHCHGF